MANIVSVAGLLPFVPSTGPLTSHANHSPNEYFIKPPLQMRRWASSLHRLASNLQHLKANMTPLRKPGIVNDANLWATETMKNPKYPLELFLRVITVSL